MESREGSLLDRMDHMRALADGATASFLQMVAQFDEQGGWRADGATSMTGWLRARYGAAKKTALEWVRVAHALRRLPRIAESYREGRLSWDQVRPLTRFATPETDEGLAETAPPRSPASLTQEAQRRRKVEREESVRKHDRRHLETWRDDEAFLHLEGMFPPEQAAALENALRQRAEQVEVEEGLVDPRGARLADAFVELATGGGEEAAPETLVVHADAEVLAGAEQNEDPRLAETEGGDRLHDEAIRRIACDAKVEWVLESDGRPVGIGRQGRAVPPRILRLLRHRDRGRCRFPGCGRRSWLKAHHLWHWGKGGPTDLDNLVLLCHTHHRLVHEGGWRTTGDPNQELEFIRPNGRTLRREPPPLPAEVGAQPFP